MTDDNAVQPERVAEPALNRRFLLRGGAVLAGAAGVTAVGAALGPTAAHAANGDPVTVGSTNSGSATTGLTITPGTSPALSLTNTGGPGLRLNSLGDDFDELAVGDLITTDLGPKIGVDLGNGPEAALVITDYDLTFLQLPVAIDPIRLVDTRKASGRTNIVDRSKAGALDTQGRLTAGSWVDVFVDTSTQDFEYGGVYLNVTVLNPLGNGYLTLYPGPDRPTASLINFNKGLNVSNGAFSAVRDDGSQFLVRIFSSNTSHILVDLTGYTIGATNNLVAAKSTSKGRAARQAKRAAQLRQRLAKSGR